jgi:hypothetical protein
LSTIKVYIKVFFALSRFFLGISSRRKETAKGEREEDNMVTEDDPARLLHVNNICAGSLY